MLRHSPEQGHLVHFRAPTTQVCFVVVVAAKKLNEMSPIATE